MAPEMSKNTCSQIGRGRPSRVPGESAPIRLSVRMTTSERGALEEVARENCVSLAEVVREAVNEYVADYRDDFQVFRKP